MRRVLVVLCCSFLLLACAHTPGKFVLTNTEQPLVWPSEPLQARYQLQGYLVGEENYIVDQAKQKFLKRAFRWIVGLALGEDDAMRLKRPQSGAYDASRQRIYVTDGNAKGVFVFDGIRGELQLWQEAGNSRGFKTPVGIALDQTGFVYVADATLGVIVVLNSDGEFVRELGRGTLRRPTGLAFDRVRQHLWVADSEAHKVISLNLNGEKLTEIGGPGDADGLFKAPTHLAYHDQRLYVTDTLNARVQIFASDGKFLNTFGKRGIYLGNLPRPKGVAVDSQGKVYVVESYYDYLLVYDGQGQPLLPIGGSGHGPGQFYLPAGVWVDELGRVFVADMFNGRVAVLTDLSQQTALSATTQQTQ
ncbi:MAG: 6-bladed beta-propeller [Gammaproteobacteria bacterium]|nr:6-bladed beta-propeller [Gammaproteobacteria bacterium]